MFGIKPKLFLLVPVLLLLLVAVACGDDATPQPTQQPPEIDVAAIRSAVAEAVSETVGPEVIEALVSKAVREAAGEELTAADVEALVSRALKDAPSSGVTAKEVEALVTSAVTEAAGQALTSEEIETLVRNAVAESAGESLTAEQISDIVKAAIPPTPTPVPTPLPTATPGFFTSSVERMVQVVEAPLGDSIVPWRLIGGVPTARPNFEALLSTDPWTAEFVPQLATEWVMSANAKDWTMTLQENVPLLLRLRRVHIGGRSPRLGEEHLGRQYHEREVLVGGYA